jgi:hypothetical protein
MPGLLMMATPGIELNLTRASIYRTGRSNSAQTLTATTGEPLLDA